MKISILGCGWLGLPLARQLVQKGFEVKGSTTSVEKIELLKLEGIVPFLIELHGVEKVPLSSATAENLTLFLENTDVLIVNIPPKLRGGQTENFVLKIQHLASFIEKSSVSKVLFVSSTSVYGEDNGLVSETSLTNPDTESGKQLLEAEGVLQSNPNFKTTILRFGGLIGEDRHPIKHLSGRENNTNPEGPVNLIHQEDCIGIIERIIEKEYWGHVLNAVAPYHPSRKKYYTEKAIFFSLPLPIFVDTSTSSKKVISSEKTEKVLGYSFLKSQL